MTAFDPSQAHCGKKVEVKYEFTSEAPGAQGLPQKQMLLLNNRPEVIYDDMLALTSGLIGLSTLRALFIPLPS